MELRLEGHKAFLSGEIDFADSDRLKEAIGKGANVLVLDGVTGGRANAMQAVAGVVAEARVTTVAVGGCSVGCAYLFLRGRERFFALPAKGKPRTAVYLRGNVFVGDKSGSATATGVYAYFRQHLAPAVPSGLISRYTTEWREGSALVLLAPTPDLPRGGVSECANVRDLQSCQPIADLDLLSSGVLTSETPYSL